PAFRTHQRPRRPCGLGLFKDLCPPYGAVKRGRRGSTLARVVRNNDEALASPADRGFGLMVPRPGSIPCRIARSLGGLRPGIHPHRHLSRPPHAWRPGSLGCSALSTPRVVSGLAGEPAHAVVLSAWPGT